MDQPRCYVIAHPTSTAVVDCIASLKKHKWEFEVVSAVNGHTVTEQTWRSIGVQMSTDGKMSRRPGAQGCWLSHWRLWNRCVETNQPMIVLEHDAVVTAPWPTDLNIEPTLIKLYTTAECKVNPAFGLWSKGAHAYTLTPTQAQRLISHARANSAQAVDKHLGEKVVSWTFYSTDLFVLNPLRGKSTTSSKVGF
jgi:GR25 family glycosyltransferase involved in LPS biosynthesis